jgi:hypothetical protein
LSFNKVKVIVKCIKLVRVIKLYDDARSTKDSKCTVFRKLCIPMSYTLNKILFYSATILVNQDLLLSMHHFYTHTQTTFDRTPLEG